MIMNTHSLSQFFLRLLDSPNSQKFAPYGSFRFLIVRKPFPCFPNKFLLLLFRSVSSPLLLLLVFCFPSPTRKSNTVLVGVRKETPSSPPSPRSTFNESNYSSKASPLKGRVRRKSSTRRIGDMTVWATHVLAAWNPKRAAPRLLLLLLLPRLRHVLCVCVCVCSTSQFFVNHLVYWKQEEEHNSRVLRAITPPAGIPLPARPTLSRTAFHNFHSLLHLLILASIHRQWPASPPSCSQQMTWHLLLWPPDRAWNHSFTPQPTHMYSSSDPSPAPVVDNSTIPMCISLCRP